MAEWFKVISDYKEENAIWHPDDTGPIFAWQEKFDKKVLEDYINNNPQWKELAIGTRKKIKNNFTYFREDANSFMTTVGNKGFFECMKGHRDDVILALEKKWIEELKYYDPSNKGTIPIQTQPSNNNKQEMDLSSVAVPFGPWLFWSESEWDGVKRDWEVYTRNESRSRSRKRSQSHHPPPQQSRSRSRSRDRKSPSKSSRKKPPPRTSSNSNNKQSDMDDQSIHSIDSQSPEV